jgi:phage terminase large subunit GpA-like protein
MARFMPEPTGPTLRIETDRIDTTSYGPEPDPAWHHIDATGHGHFYAPGYPTLHEVTETRYDPDDGEEWQAHVRWECPHCGEWIIPATRQTVGQSTVAGCRSFFIDEEEVDRDTFIAAWRPLAEQRLADEEASI